MFITLVNALHITHWGRVTHICVGKLTIIGSDNGLSPDRRQAIIWTNAGLLLIGPLGKNFNEISIKILSFSFKKMRLKVSSAKWRPFCLGLNVLIHYNSLWRLQRQHRRLEISRGSRYITILYAVTRTCQSYPGGRLNIKMSYRNRIPMFKIRRSRDRLIFNMGIPYLERRSLYWDGALVISGSLHWKQWSSRTYPG